MAVYRQTAAVAFKKNISKRLFIMAAFVVQHQIFLLILYYSEILFFKDLSRNMYMCKYSVYVLK